MRGFGLTLEGDDGSVRLSLRGELDLEHAYLFDEELRRVEERRPACLILDLHELRFVDSCGIARLLAARRRARREGRRLLLVRVSPEVQRLFALTRVDEVFDFAGDA